MHINVPVADISVRIVVPVVLIAERPFIVAVHLGQIVGNTMCFQIVGDVGRIALTCHLFKRRCIYKTVKLCVFGKRVPACRRGRSVIDKVSVITGRTVTVILVERKSHNADVKSVVRQIVHKNGRL